MRFIALAPALLLGACEPPQRGDAAGQNVSAVGTRLAAARAEPERVGGNVAEPVGLRGRYELTVYSQKLVRRVYPNEAQCEAAKRTVTEDRRLLAEAGAEPGSIVVTGCMPLELGPARTSKRSQAGAAAAK